METLVVLQFEYYLLTGLWPVVHIKSFEKVTDQKTDKWLVKLIGLLTAAIGAVLFLMSNHGDARLLGIVSPACFAAIDFYYGTQRTIPPVYFIDGMIQVALIVGWLLVILF